MADRIVVATDAGREGELIFRYIYSFLECRKPFVRLWISSLTDKAIREGLQNLRPGEEYDNLYLSAKARSEADWVVGINASQALAIAAGRGVWSLGRVQTPTLAIICSRYLENKAFEPAAYFQLKLSTAKDATLFAALSTQRFNDKETAQAAYAAVMDADEVRVVTVEHKGVKEQPPLLYDLTTLQKDANTRYGFSADKTPFRRPCIRCGRLAAHPPASRQPARKDRRLCRHTLFRRLFRCRTARPPTVGAKQRSADTHTRKTHGPPTERQRVRAEMARNPILP